MKTIYLIKDGENVCHFLSEVEMKAAGYLKANKIVTEEEYNSNGCYARVINGKIVVGKTEEEKAEEERQKQAPEFLGVLNQIDMEAGASREVRDISIAAGVALNAIRVIVPRLADELGINLPVGFGSEVTSAEDILNLAPPSKATEKEKADFAVFKALLIITYYDPAINPGLAKMTEAEMKAIPIRKQMASLGETE